MTDYVGRGVSVEFKKIQQFQGEKNQKLKFFCSFYLILFFLKCFLKDLNSSSSKSKVNNAKKTYTFIVILKHCRTNAVIKKTSTLKLLSQSVFIIYCDVKQICTIELTK